MLRAGCRLVGCEEMELEVVADSKPDELGRVELRRNVALLEAEQPCIERSRCLPPIAWNRNGDVLQLESGHACPSKYRRQALPRCRFSRVFVRRLDDRSARSTTNPIKERLSWPTPSFTLRFVRRTPTRLA